MTAVVNLIAVHGHAGLTVERIVGAAKISRSTFYRYFTNRQEAVLAAHELVFERFMAALGRACEPGESWPERVNAGIGATLEFAAAEPDQARMLVAEFLSPDVRLAQRAGRSHDRLAELLAEGRRYQPKASVLPDSLERALIGGIATVVARGLIADERQQFPDLQAQLVEFTLLPYLGTAGAARAVSGTA